MGTWGSICVTGAREKTDEIILQTSHDGFEADTLKELLHLPVSIYEKAKWETENLRKKWKEGEEPSRLATYTRAFFFHDLKTEKDLPVDWGFDEFARSWCMSIPLDIFSNTLATYLMWQRPSKWWVTSKLAWDKEEADVTLVVEDNRTPNIEFLYEGNEEEDLEFFRKVFDECIEDYPLDLLEEFNYFDVTPKFEVIDGTTVKVRVNIDLVVVALLWEEIKQETKNGESDSA